MQQRLRSANIPALDGMRALAVFLVIFYHFGFAAIPGGLGVLGFFVLSGFLITWLLLKENDKQGTISLSNFYIRRVLRIFPAFYAYWIGVVLLMLIAGRHVPWRSALSSFFYLGNYYNAIVRPADSFVSHTWSLAIEEQFYLLWPALLLLFRKDLVRLSRVILGIILFEWIYRGILAYGFGVNQSYIYNAFDTRLDHLMVGCLLAVQLYRGAWRPVWASICSRTFLPVATITLLTFSVFLGAHFGTAYRDVIGFALDPILVAILLVQLVQFSAKPAWSWINWPWMKFLGRISYSLYLYQEITLYPARRILAGHSVALQLLAAVAGTVLIATVSYYFIERPFLKLKSKFGGEARPGKTHSAIRLTTALGTSQTWNATD
ncbi:MAG: acyltransferase family protein [Candidatus Acidiferrales bacterium]